MLLPQEVLKGQKNPRHFTNSARSIIENGGLQRHCGDNRNHNEAKSSTLQHEIFQSAKCPNFLLFSSLQNANQVSYR